MSRRPWFAPRRKPDFVIGDDTSPYMRRWWLIRRNHRFNVYLHQILRSDDDRALHDHPWWNISIILRGGYREIVPDFSGIETPYVRVSDVPLKVMERRAGDVILRRPTDAHRLEIVPQLGSECWSLFLTGPLIREWGFHCPQGWVHRHLFTNPFDRGQVGRGCG